MRLLQKTLLVVCALAVSACTSSFRSNVATFHEMDVPGGERVVLTPINPEKRDSLEFRQYATALAHHLKSYGYRETGDAEPELVVGFDITIDDGREKLRNRPNPYPHHYWDVRWPWHGYWSSPFHHPFYDRNTVVVAGTYYTATLTLELRKPNGDLVFEGRAETETRNKALPEIVPFLAQALFQSFPGESGVTRRVVITPPEAEPTQGS